MRIVQISDTHINHRGGVTNKNFETLASFVNDVLRPDLIVNTGDVSVLSPDSAEDRETARTLHERFTAPLLVVPGNHDVGEPGDTPWAGISVTSERVAGHRGAFGTDHWVELRDEWALIGINSEIMSSGLPEEAEQWEWLAGVPGLVGDRTAILFLHKPVWSPLEQETEHAIALPAAARDRLLQVLAPVKIAAVCSGHLHCYSTGRQGDVLTVSAPSAAFVHVENGVGHFPGLHQVGVVELVCENGAVRPYFRSVPGVIESQVWTQPEFAAAWAEVGPGPLPGAE
jgi:3',5'-cyclic AMP phosphodiesterase CpdA